MLVCVLAGTLACLAGRRICYDENDDIYFCPLGTECQAKWDGMYRICGRRNYSCCDRHKQETIAPDR